MSAVSAWRHREGLRTIVCCLTPPAPRLGTTTAAGRADGRVSGMKIDVDTKDGVVTLSGNVRTAAQKTAAVQIARGTDNVKDVRDNLTVGR